MKGFAEIVTMLLDVKFARFHEIRLKFYTKHQKGNVKVPKINYSKIKLNSKYEVSLIFGKASQFKKISYTGKFACSLEFRM